MAGIYIHIPFCKQACHYCNFHFSTSLKLKNELIDALLKETQQRSNYLADATIETIYFGGGTPSLLSGEVLQQILSAIYANYTVADNIEITLEANPDDLSLEKLQELKQAGINRLSIGIQSFRDEDLKYMNRSHNAEQAKSCVQIAQQLGFENITIDLIYGTPGLSNADWQENLNLALKLNVPHISSYCLTVEPKTALAHFVKTGQSADVDEQLAHEQFLILQRTLTDAGFEHYEISNFAKPGYQSKHNSSYWAGIPYVGLGPAAHSFDGTNRQWNIANNALYIKALQDDITYFELEELSEKDRFNEALMIGLRTTKGVNLTQLAASFPAAWIQDLQDDITPHLEKGSLVKTETQLQISPASRFISDTIISDLFRV